MTKTYFRIAQRLLAVGVVVSLAGHCWAVATLDASNDVGGSSTARELKSNNFWAQSFTVSTDGLLSKIDVQLGKFPGATGDVEFAIRPLVGGLPTINDRERLFVSTIDVNDIPVINSLADPPPFVSVDVTGAGIHAQPGDVYAISMRRGGVVTPTSAWHSKPNSYADGTGFFRSLLNVPWSPNVDDLGFQTWIDPEPTAPFKLRVDPTFDVEYRPGEVSSLIEGEASLVVGGSPGSTTFPEQRPIMEFPLVDLPVNAIVEGAHLEFDYFVSSGAPRMEVTGFSGDGLASFTDATEAGTILAITGPTSASSPGEMPIDTDFVASLVGEASHLGIRMRSLDLPQYVGFTTLEAHSSLAPTRLVIDYTLPQEGDFNLDGVVDGDDLTDPVDGWEARYGVDLDGNDFLAWQRQVGSGVQSFSGAQAVPEPSTSILLVGVTAIGMLTRRGGW